jgi:N-acetylneuraminate synthase
VKWDDFSIYGRDINDQQAPFIIAELSGNHGQDLEVAKSLIIAAAEAGAHAIKLQTYTADTLTLDSKRPEFCINDDASLWQGENLYSLYEKAHTPWEWHRELFQLARDNGLIAFSSPFDESSVDFLSSLNVPCYKIASFELNHFPLLKRVAQTAKPVIMSTGMATADEIEQAVAYLYKHGCRQLALLKCTSCYPAPVTEANLKTMVDMKQRFNIPVGLSDHSQGVGVSITAAALGANIIERHFVLSADSKAVDAAFSLVPEQLALLVKETETISGAIGEVQYGPVASEQDSVKYRRSIYVVADIEVGEILDAKHIKVVRPGLGLAPKYWDAVIGKRVARAIAANTPLVLDDLENLEA